MIDINRDILFVLRLFIKQPASSLIGILILGIGFGISIMIYTLVNGVLNSNPPFSNSKFVLKALNYKTSASNLEMRLRVFQTIYKESNSFKQVAGYQRHKITARRNNNRSRAYKSSFVSWNFFDVVNATPVLGRTFTKADLHSSNGATAVITHKLWQREFDGNDNVVGSQFIADGVPITVIGVMPEHFIYPLAQQLWVLSDFGLTYSAGKYVAKGGTITLCMLKDGVSKAQAKIELHKIIDKLSTQYPDLKDDRISVSLEPYEKIRNIRAEVQPMLYALLLFSLLLLAVACSNISNLVMVRISGRQHELVTRKALGASPSHIVIQVLIEGALFCIGGLLFGVLVFALGREYCWSIFKEVYPRTPIWWHMNPDWNVLLFSIALVIFCIAVSCLTPAIRTLSAEVNQILKDESRTATWLFIGNFVKQIVTFQVMGSTALLIVTLMIVLIAYHVLSWQLPYDPERILAFRFHMKQSYGYKTTDDVYAYLDNLQTKLNSIPGVQKTGIISIGSGVTRQARRIKFENPPDNIKQAKAGIAVIHGPLMDLYDIKPLQGRFFTDSDTMDTEKVVIVNKHFVDTFFKYDDPIGKRIQVQGPRLGADEENKRGKKWTQWLTIIGVAPNLQRKLLPGQSSADYTELYIPVTQLPSRFLTLLVKTEDKNAVGLVIPIKNAMRDGFPQLLIGGGSTVQDAVIGISRLQYLLSAIIIVFGSIALFVTVVGLLGLILFATLQRRREFGIRSAIGADSKEIVLMVYRQAFWQIAIGLLFGIIIAISATGYVKENMEASAFPVEAPSFTIGIVISLLACVIAISIPALRATKVQPNEVLRVD